MEPPGRPGGGGPGSAPGPGRGVAPRCTSVLPRSFPATPVRAAMDAWIDHRMDEPLYPARGSSEAWEGGPRAARHASPCSRGLHRAHGQHVARVEPRGRGGGARPARTWSWTRRRIPRACVREPGVRREMGDAEPMTERPIAADLLLRHARILTMDVLRRILADGANAIRDARLADVGRDPDLAPQYSPAVRDLRGALVHPGLVGARAHHQRPQPRVCPQEAPGMGFRRDAVLRIDRQRGGPARNASPHHEDGGERDHDVLRHGRVAGRRRDCRCDRVRGLCGIRGPAHLRR